jgi:hypothetical protein
MHQQTKGLLKEQVIMRIVYFGIIFFCSLASTHSTWAFNQEGKCRTISISSAGNINFEESRVLRIAHGASGLGGVADYVSIVSPAASSGIDSRNVREIIVMADVRHVSFPECGPLRGKGIPTFSCAVSLPGGKLKLIVNFDGNSSEGHSYQDETKVIATDISQNVLSCTQ